MPPRANGKVKSGKRTSLRKSGALEYAHSLRYLKNLHLIEEPDGTISEGVIPTQAFERLMQEHWAMASALRSKEEDLVDWEDAVKELTAEGLVSA